MCASKHMYIQMHTSRIPLTHDSVLLNSTLYQRDYQKAVPRFVEERQICPQKTVL